MIALLALVAALQQPNIIIFVLDDVGKASLAQAYTPNIDTLASSGREYAKTYSHPWCQPSRDSMLFGTYFGSKRGVGCDPPDPVASIPPGEDNFVQALQRGGYLTGLVGKWHLGRSLSKEIPWYLTPQSIGFDHWWAGAYTGFPGCAPGQIHDDGVFRAKTHSTQDERDAALSLVGKAEDEGKPFFLWVGFSDAHGPWRRPPNSILPPQVVLPINPSDRRLYLAEIAALDFVIGQILAELPSNTVVIVLSENGTPEEVIHPPTTRAKFTIWEKGTRVPLIINGPGIPVGVETTPAHLYDIPATVLGLGSFRGLANNGRNLLQPAPSDHFVHSHRPVVEDRVLIEERFKLYRFGDGTMEFYDLDADPKEESPLPLSGEDYRRLLARFSEVS